MPNIILVNRDYLDANALKNATTYVMRLGIIGGYAIDPNHAYDQMMLIKTAFHKTEGVQLKHFVVTFSTRELYRLDFDDILNLGFQIGKFFGEYQMVYGVHYDTDHFHLHCALNTVSFVDGHKYCDGLSGFWELKKMLQQLFPRSYVNIFRSFPGTINEYSFTDEDYLLQIG